jgi:hypothetical protein
VKEGTTVYICVYNVIFRPLNETVGP